MRMGGSVPGHPDNGGLLWGTSALLPRRAWTTPASGATTMAATGCPGRKGHERSWSYRRPTQIRPRLEPAGRRRRRSLARIRPVFSERMRKVGGDRAADGFLAAMQTHARRARHVGRRAAAPAHRPAGLLEPPGEEHARSGDGDDAAAALRAPRRDRHSISRSSTRRPACACRDRRRRDRRAVVRAYNIVTAEYFRDLGDRMTPAAIIPMHTPDEAIAELEYVTKRARARRSACSAAACPAPAAAAGKSTPRRRVSACGTTCSASTATTTTTRSGRSAWSSASRRPSTARAATRACGCRRRTSSTTTSVISPPPATRSAKAMFLGGVTRRFPACGWRSSRAAWAGPASCSATWSGTGSGATPGAGADGPASSIARCS